MSVAEIIKYYIIYTNRHFFLAEYPDTFNRYPAEFIDAIKKNIVQIINFIHIFEDTIKCQEGFDIYLDLIARYAKVLKSSNIETYAAFSEMIDERDNIEEQLNNMIVLTPELEETLGKYGPKEIIEYYERAFDTLQKSLD